MGISDFFGKIKKGLAKTRGVFSGVTALFPFDINVWYGLPAQGTTVDEWADDNFDHNGLGFIGGTSLHAHTELHPIDAASPFFGKTSEDLARLSSEILILIQGFDDTFSQQVNSRYSYRHDEMVWGAKFIPTFKVDANGDLVVEVDRIDEMKLVG